MTTEPIDSRLDTECVGALMRMWRRLGFGRAAVRSSGYSEDSSDKSFAGVFESILHVRREELLQAVARVRQSFLTGTAATYAEQREDGGVIVQKMVPAEWAGVLFTRHPNEAGQALVEMVAGTGDSLVSGASTPQTYRLGRLSGYLLDEQKPPIDLAPLHALGRKAEGLFGRPQDVEWAYADGRFYVLQSRDITRVGLSAPSTEREILESERARLLDIFREAAADEVVLAQAEVSELVPRPTPATLSLMESLWQPGGAIDQACRFLGLNYTASESAPPYLVSVFGNLYLNRIEARSRVQPLKPWKVYRIVRSADAIEQHLTEEFEPEFLRNAAILDAIDPGRLSTEEVLALLMDIRRRFTTETYAKASVVTLVATILLTEARRALEERNLNPANTLGEMPETPMSRALDALAAKPREERKLSDFLAVFGHRAAQDYELSCPRYAEDLRLAEFTMVNMLAVARPRNRSDATADAQDRRYRALSQTVQRARRFQALKERVKHHCLREIAVMRRLLVAIDQRLQLDGGIFQLTLDEIARLGDAEYCWSARDLINERLATTALFKRVQSLPSEISIVALETLSFDEEKASGPASAQGFKGTLVAGYGPVEGRALIIGTDDEPIDAGDVDAFPADAIIVSRLIHPQWLAWLARARGLVCEVGGWLSHTAILAREYNLPMIVGVHGLDRIQNGDLIRLHADGTVELLKSVAEQDLVRAETV